MIENIIPNLPNIAALLALPAFFLLFWARDVVKMKVDLVRGKKKGAKFVIGISTDKTIRIGAETPVEKNKFVFKNDQGIEMEIGIDANRLFYAPQFGVQAAIITQGAKTLFDPFASKDIDPVDGDYIDVAIKKAMMLGTFGAGWGATKEQKLLLVALVLIAGILLMQFTNMSQVGELATTIGENHVALMEYLQLTPLSL